MGGNSGLGATVAPAQVFDILRPDRQLVAVMCPDSKALSLRHLSFPSPALPALSIPNVVQNDAPHGLLSSSSLSQPLSLVWAIMDCSIDSHPAWHQKSR